MNTPSPVGQETLIRSETDLQCHRRRRLQREPRGENGGIWEVEEGVWKEAFDNKGRVLEEQSR